MLHTSNRFHGHNGVRRVYRLGRPIRSQAATLHILQNDKVKISKAAVVVSRKVDKSAVKRNRIRRRVYELIRHELKNFSRPTELVVTVYSSDLVDMPSSEIEALMKDLLSKARL